MRYAKRAPAHVGRWGWHTGPNRVERRIVRCLEEDLMPPVPEVYIEDAVAVSAIEFAEGCEPQRSAKPLAGTTIQWTASAPDKVRHAVIAGVSGHVDANEVSVFLGAVGTERWWLGEACLRVSLPDGEVLLLPGADAAFLHVGG